MWGQVPGGRQPGGGRRREGTRRAARKSLLPAGGGAGKRPGFSTQCIHLQTITHCLALPGPPPGRRRAGLPAPGLLPGYPPLAGRSAGFCPGPAFPGPGFSPRKVSETPSLRRYVRTNSEEMEFCLRIRPPRPGGCRHKSHSPVRPSLSNPSVSPAASWRPFVRGFPGRILAAPAQTVRPYANYAQVTLPG